MKMIYYLHSSTNLIYSLSIFTYKDQYEHFPLLSIRVAAAHIRQERKWSSFSNMRYPVATVTEAVATIAQQNIGSTLNGCATGSSLIMFFFFSAPSVSQ